jgi:hypothetical protein
VTRVTFLVQAAFQGFPRIELRAVAWNTRQKSNLRSKPDGDTGNPRLAYWIRRQESDLRGLQNFLTDIEFGMETKTAEPITCRQR